MTDGVNVDFGLLGKPPDYVGDYANAFQVGRTLAGQGIQGNAFGRASPSTASLADHVASMSPQVRADAAGRADILANIAVALKGRPYTERRAILGHMAPALAAQGLAPETLAAFDPTDADLDAAVASAREVGGMLAVPNAGISS